MSWFRTEADLVDHPKVFRLAELLNNPCAGWYYVRLLAWTSRYAARGRLRDVTFGALENACGWRGESGALLKAFVAVGLVDELSNQDDGATLEVHDWWEVQRQYVVKAEKDAERKRRERSRRADVTRNGSATSRGASTGRHADGHADVPRDGARTRRDETKRNETEESPPTPPSVATTEAPPPPLAPKASPPQHVPIAYSKPTSDPSTWGPDDFFAWAQAKRQEAGLVGERDRPRNLHGWYSSALMTLNGNVEALQEAFYAFGETPHWQQAKPALPFRAFISQWDRFVPRGAAHVES